MHMLKIFCIPVLLIGCGVDAGAQPEARSEAVIQSASPPALGPGAYALPLIDGWQTLSVSHSFDTANNALVLAGGATGNGGGGGGYWYMPVPLGVGQGLAAVGLTVRDTAGAPILAYIDVRDTLSGEVSNWCQGASNGTGLVHGFTFACPGAMPASAQMVLRITPQGQAATVYGAWVQPVGYSVISPTTLSPGNNNDYNPPGFAVASVVKLKAGDGWPFLTGMSNCVPGRQVTLVLDSVTTPLTLTKLDGSSQPGDQLVLPLPSGAVTIQMTSVDQAVTFLCDGSIAKWRLISSNF
jgi:hypothetical protein